MGRGIIWEEKKGIRRERKEQGGGITVEVDEGRRHGEMDNIGEKGNKENEEGGGREEGVYVSFITVTSSLWCLVG